MVTPIITVLGAVTKIVTLYMVDVGVVWVWLTSILAKSHVVADFLVMFIESPAV